MSAVKRASWWLSDHLPAAVHLWYATTFGYFWLPCPLCSRYFGGHQWRDIDGKESSIPDPDRLPLSGYCTGTCPACTRAGRGWNDGSVADDPGVVTFDPDQGRWI